MLHNTISIDQNKTLMLCFEREKKKKHPYAALSRYHLINNDVAYYSLLPRFQGKGKSYKLYEFFSAKKQSEINYTWVGPLPSL